MFIDCIELNLNLNWFENSRKIQYSLAIPPYIATEWLLLCAASTVIRGDQATKAADTHRRISFLTKINTVEYQVTSCFLILSVYSA